MRKLTLSFFAILTGWFFSAALCAQETSLPDDAQMIRLMRQFGHNAAPGGYIPALKSPTPDPQYNNTTSENGIKAPYQLFDNGPFVTHPGGGAGGADFSMTYSPYQQTGYQVNWPNYRITDDFVVSGTESWTIESIRLFAYQSTSPTSPSPIRKAYIQIWTAAPNAGGTIIWGDLVTDRLSSTAWSNCYRGSSLTQTNRPIMKVDCNTPGLVLPPGSYWIDFTIDGSPSYGAAAIVPVTIPGKPVTGNGYYTFNNGVSWMWLGTVIYQQGAPFMLFGYKGNPEAPEAIDDFAVTPATLGALSASLSWTNPAATQSGNPLTTFSVSIYRNGGLIYQNNNPVAGTSENFTDTPPQPGVYQYEIFATKSHGNSPKTTVNVYVGEDVPAAPVNVTLTPVNNNNDAEITWVAPAEGLHGGYFTGVTGYTIVRMPDSTVLATSWSGTQPFYDNTIPELGYYTYRVIAVNAIGNGGTGVSNGELIGPLFYTRSAYANNFATHEFVSADVLSGKQTFIAHNSFDPAASWPRETVATYAKGAYYIGDAVNKQLYIKTDHGNEILLGSIELDGEPLLPTGLAYDETTSTMYIGVLSESTLIKSLCTIDLRTLELTVITSQSVIYDLTYGLVFLPDGFLYSIDIGNESLIRIDPATGAKTVVGNTGFNADGWQALSYEPTMNRIYSYTHGLYEYDRYGYYNISTGLFTPLTNELESYNTAFIIKDPLVLAEVDAVAFYTETPEVKKHKFGVGETTPVHVKVGNYGMNAASFNVTLEIGDDYTETISVAHLGSAQEQVIAFPDWTPMEAGVYDLVLTVSDPGGDGHPENNTVSRTVTVYEGCRHILTMYALWEDNWWGDWAEVYINSDVYFDYITKPVGMPYELPVYAEEGDIITFIYHGDGSYSEEHSWELTDGEGNLLFTGVGATGAVIEQTATANCPPSTRAGILDYSFNTENNPALFTDITGLINPLNHTITLSVPENVNRSALVAAFTLSDGATAYIRGILQESGVSANNFNEPVEYTVVAEAGNSQIWTVTVNTVPCTLPWEYAQTGKVHNISIPLAIAPEIFGTPLAAFDWIGVFYLNNLGEETCGGAVQWNGTTGVVVNAYGDDPTTVEKDGFATGEAFIWKLKPCGNTDEFQALAIYEKSMPNQGYFANFGLSKLTSLRAALIQNFSFLQGWNSISSNIVPFDPEVEVLFDPIVEELTILRNLSSLYWPSEGLNTIGNWNNKSGYVIKLTQPVDFQIGGEAFVEKQLTIPAGWSYLPVLSTCEADITGLFGVNITKVIIIQELIGTGVFWPEYGINTIGAFEPGKAYIIKLSAPATVTFPECSDKSYKNRLIMQNKVDTPWGEMIFTPEKQVTLFPKNAIAGLQPGDVIGAFNADNRVCGYISVVEGEKNLAMTLFGKDQTQSNTGGYSPDEPVHFRLLRTGNGKMFDLEVEYDRSAENHSGRYYTGSLAVISKMTLKHSGNTEAGITRFTVMPNPADDVVNITSNQVDDSMVELYLYDVYGSLVAKDILTQSLSMDISTLSSGLYMVFLKTPSSYEVVRLIKK